MELGLKQHALATTSKACIGLTSSKTVLGSEA